MKLREASQQEDFFESMANGYVSIIQKIMGNKSNIPKVVVIKFEDKSMPNGKIAKWNHKDNVMTIKTTALNNPGYLLNIIKHELIHAAIGRLDGDSHKTEIFNSLSDALKLAKKFRD